LNLQNTGSKIEDISNNTALQFLNLINTGSVITDVLSNTEMIEIGLVGTDSLITDVPDLCRKIYVFNTNNTAANNNTLIQNLIDNPRTGPRKLTFTAHADIDQSNVTLLVNAGWDITQL